MGWVLGAHNMGSGEEGEALVAEADTQDRQSVSEVLQDLEAEGGIFGLSWAWREHNAFGLHRRDLWYRDGMWASYL